MILVLIAEDVKELANSDAPENNPKYTTVFVGNLAPEVSSYTRALYFDINLIYKNSGMLVVLFTFFFIQQHSSHILFKQLNTTKYDIPLELTVN